MWFSRTSAPGQRIGTGLPAGFLKGSHGQLGPRRTSVRNITRVITASNRFKG